MKLKLKHYCIIFFMLYSVIFYSIGSTEEKTLILAIGGESAEGYDPTMGWGRYGNPLFQSTLLKRDEKLNIVNDLAVQYTINETCTVWKVTLRKDAFFSDGKPLTAEDVVYTFKTAAQSGGKVDLSMLQQVKAEDAYTITFILKYPCIVFINRLITLGIVPKHAHSPTYSRKPIGSGPYTMVNWTEGQQLIVQGNPLYYGKKPLIQRITFLFTGEDASFAAAKAGNVAMIAVPQTLTRHTISGMRLHPVQSVDCRGIMFPMVVNEGKKTAKGLAIGNNVTADVAIRKAINYAINRKAMIEGILEGYGTPAFGPADYLPWGQPPASFKDGDTLKARNILTLGGWKDVDNDGIVEKNGVKAQFPLVYPATDNVRTSAAVVVADVCKKIGIQVDLWGKSWDEIYKLMHSCVIVFGWGSHDPSEVYNLFHSSVAGVEVNNPGFYKNHRVDELLDSALRCSSFEKSLTYWNKAQWDGHGGYSALGDSPWAFFFNLTHTYFVSESLDIGVSQIEPHGHGWPITANITQWKWK